MDRKEEEDVRTNTEEDTGATPRRQKKDVDMAVDDKADALGWVN